MRSIQFSLRNLLELAFWCALLLFAYKLSEDSQFGSWGASHLMTSDAELPSIELSAVGFSFEEPRAAIGFVRVQSNSVVESRTCPGTVDRRTISFYGRDWKVFPGKFQLVVFVDDELKFAGHANEPWVERLFRSRAKTTVEDAWKIVDHVGAR